MSVRVRFAPSPTGMLHIGSLRTALYNYLFARRQGGRFILRIEDTDQGRFVEGAEDDIRESLAWAGVTYDEGPDVGGDAGPYRQSERAHLYRQYVDQLIDAGHAYIAFDTKEDLQAMRERHTTKENPAPKYDMHTREEMANSFTLSAEEVQARLDQGDAHVVRLAVPADETVSFDDLIRDKVSFASQQIDDQILLKSDGMPTYHMANVVDDHLMGITHIIRGEEWLSSTPKHILLYRFLGWEPPAMAHLPLILNPNGGKLSKRHAEKLGIPVNVVQYREAGYEPEALVNYLAFLGWNPGTEEELFTLDGLTQAFDVTRVGSAGVKYDFDKLNWMNAQHLRLLDPDERSRRIKPYLEKAGISVDDAYLETAISLVGDRLVKADEMAAEFRFLFEDPTEYDEKTVRKRWKEDSSELVTAYADELDNQGTFDAATCEATLKGVVEAREIGMGKLMLPVRLSVSGMPSGPDLYPMMGALGKETVLRRLRKATQILP